MVGASGLDKPTPHAPLPNDPTSAADWIATANSEGGQLDKANAEKAGVTGIGRQCDAWAQSSKKKAERKPVLRRIFG